MENALFLACYSINSVAAGCRQQPSPICLTDVSSCICVVAHTQVSENQTWKGSSQGRKNASSWRNRFSSLSLFFHPSMFRVLTLPPFSRGGDDRNMDTWMSPSPADFGWEALAGASFTLEVQITPDKSFCGMCILKTQQSRDCSPICAPFWASPHIQLSQVKALGLLAKVVTSSR